MSWVCQSALVMLLCTDVVFGYHLSQGANKWYELQDLHVKDILPPVITLSDSYIQVLLY